MTQLKANERDEESLKVRMNGAGKEWQREWNGMEKNGKGKVYLKKEEKEWEGVEA